MNARKAKQAIRVVLAGLILGSGIGAGQVGAPVTTVETPQPCSSTAVPGAKEKKKSEPKPCDAGWKGTICRKLAEEKARLEAIARQKEAQEGGKVVKDSKGTIDASVLPSPGDLTAGSATKPKATTPPCSPAASPAASVKPATPPPAAAILAAPGYMWVPAPSAGIPGATPPAPGAPYGYILVQAPGANGQAAEGKK